MTDHNEVAAADDRLITAGMLADRLRPLVLGSRNSCIGKTPMVPLHIATVTSIYMHLERLAKIDGEVTAGSIAALQFPQDI